MTASTVAANLGNMEKYNIGNRDERVWGWFEVTDTGVENSEEYCEKNIGILPRQALSLQRHQGRREVWEVVEGTMTVIVNGELFTLEAGEKILIPLKAAHCMINLTDEQVVVRERQIGLCREEDNDRLCDLNGRETVAIEAADLDALKSIAVYKKVTAPLLDNNSSKWFKSGASNMNTSDSPASTKDKCA